MLCVATALLSFLCVVASSFSKNNPTVKKSKDFSGIPLDATHGPRSRKFLITSGVARIYISTRSVKFKYRPWSSGLSVLVGDAAYAPSLLAGEGAGLAMAGAYVLAAELERANGDHTVAFSSYERR